MSSRDQAAGPSRPRWDGGRVLFEISDGDERIACAISRSALQDLSQRRHHKPAELLLCSANARPQIEAMALRKLRARTAGLSGTLNIWADDVDDEPSSGASARSSAYPHGS